ncbi:MAG TPA: ribonuclease Z [Actinocrinis sp.]|jgi:ribonuclease Z
MRELAVLGTASQSPTRARNHNGYFLRWDDEGFLFDPGEGTQRQMLLAGVAAPDVTRVCVTHFHGDHCFGLPGVLSRMALDQVAHPVHCHYPASGKAEFDRLRWIPEDYAARVLREVPAAGEAALLADAPFGTLTARRLRHRVEAYGYRIEEPPGRRMLPDRLAALGVAGPDVGRLQREGSIEIRVPEAGGSGDAARDATRTVTLEEVSAERPGQVAAFVMDTGPCDAIDALADGADLLVIEATYLAAQAQLAADYLHLTAGQAAAAAARCRVRTLVLTHFSSRYTDMSEFEREAREHFDGELVVAADLDRVPVPARRD